MDLALAPAGAPEIPDGGVVASEKTTTAVDIDQLFDLFDRKTRRGLTNFVRGSATLEFDPATSSRTFRLAMSDYAIAVVHEPLVRLVAAEAPGVRLSIGHLGPRVTSTTTLVDASAASAGSAVPA